MELYNQQQALAKAQLAMEQSAQVLAELAYTRAGTEERLSAFKQQAKAGQAQVHTSRHQVRQNLSVTDIQLLSSHRI